MTDHILSSPHLSSVGSVLRTTFKGFGVTDSLVVLVLATTLWLPEVIGGKAWAVPAVLLLLLAAYKVVEQRRIEPLPLVLLAYIGVYVIAALHGWALTSSDAARFFLRPLVALAVAELVTTQLQRLRILILIIVFVALEIPVTAGQAIANVAKYGRDATVGADSVTGTLGASQAGVVTLVATAAAVLVVAAWLARMIGWRTAAFGASAFVAIGVFSATRAVMVFVPVAAAAIASLASNYTRDRPPHTRLIGIVAASVAAIPVLYVATIAIYPAAFVGVFSSEALIVLGGKGSFLGAPAACSGESKRMNLVQNGGFEQEEVVWTGSQGARLSVDRSRAKLGERSLKLVADRSRADQAWMQSPIRVCKGKTYKASAWFLAPAGVKVEIYVSDNKRSASHYVAGTGSWRRVSVDLKVRRSAAAVEVYPKGKVATTIWVDDIRLAEAPAAAPKTSATPPPAPPVGGKTEATTTEPGTHGQALGKPTRCLQGNLLANDSFEGGVTGWTSSAGTAISNSPKAKFGHQSLRLVADGSRWGQGVSTQSPVCAGKTYRASAWIWAPKGVGVVLALSDGKVGIGNAVIGKGRWQRLDQSLRVKTSTVVVTIYSPKRVPISIWIDDVRLEQNGARTSSKKTTKAAPPSGKPTGPSTPKAKPAPTSPKPIHTTPQTSQAPAPSPVGVQLLPGRFVQLKLALNLSARGGLWNAVLGRGPGATKLDPAYHLAQFVPEPQRTGSTWIGVLLTETGWLGLSAFIVLLGWLVLLGRRLWNFSAPGGPDRLLGAALPGLVALTAVGAAFTTILDVRGYSLVFWLLVGVAISAARELGVFKLARPTPPPPS